MKCSLHTLCFSSRLCLNYQIYTVQYNFLLCCWWHSLIVHGVLSRRHEYSVQDVCSLLPEPELLSENLPQFCFASFCPLFCWISVYGDLQPYVPSQYWWFIRLVVKYPSYIFFPLCSHLERGMMSSLWYVICLISSGKNGEMCLMLIIHSRVLTQCEVAWSRLPSLAGIIYLCHHAAFWGRF